MSFPLVGNPSSKGTSVNSFQKKDSGQTGMTGNQTYGLLGIFRSMPINEQNLEEFLEKL